MAIRVLHCMHSLHGGGAERQLSIMLNHQNHENLEMAVFCVNDDMSNLREGVCKVYKIKDSKNYPFKLVGEINSVIDEFKPDIVHTWLPPSISVPALISAKLKKKIAVASYRNKKIFESWIRVPEFLTDLFLSNAIVSNNPPVQSSYLFRKLFDIKKNAIISNAVDVPDDCIKTYVDKKSSKLKLLFVGRLTEQKNWQVLLNGLSMVDKKYDWELTICGKGEDEHAFVAMAKSLGIYENLNMLGYITDVYSIMNKSDVLVLPSWYEGMPNVVLESMTLGLPSIVSIIEAHTSLFNDNSGVKFFDPTSPEQLSDIVEGFLSGEIDMEKLSEDGKQFSEKYTPDKLLENYFQFYKKLLN